ncbi:hypothetical protein [Bacillus sp. MUM 13]|uniref:hypothetical protein n=1 Tax=Bacillus sp. MUM 13 TaxID=1678001 RepID=UPI0008F5EC18|nr:hypothetical protein [Bacillus sp. MUM 13]OIK12109.1 hypothetical protein BIV59_10005 [Bacillus sp. MUM 13]
MNETSSLLVISQVNLVRMFTGRKHTQIRAALQKELAIMKDTIKYDSLNIPKEKNAVAIATPR